MKLKNKLQFSGIITIALCIFSHSCSKNESIPDQMTGKLKLDINLSILVNSAESLLKSASSEDFQVEIFNSGSADPTLTFEHAFDMPESLELPEGEYYVIASSGENPAAAFDTPYYYGESELFRITAGETTTADILCSLANIMVTVVYSDQVIASFDDYSTTVSNDTGSLYFIKDESRAGFFISGPFSIESKLDYLDGGVTKTKTLTGNVADPQPGKHYEIHIDATPTESELSVSISVDESIETVIINIQEEKGSDEINPGDLLITEIMYNPKALGDTEGEWIEIYNNSGKDINLKDLIIRRDYTDKHQISSDVNLVPESYAVLGRTASAAEHVDYVYSSITLTNAGSELMISTYGTDGTNGTAICSVDYGAEGFNTNLDGKSIQLDPSVKDASAAQLGSNWCPSTVAYSTGDLGTPGLANSACE